MELDRLGGKKINKKNDKSDILFLIQENKKVTRQVAETFRQNSHYYILS